MSDLQCPAFILLFTPESIVGGDLRGRRLSRVIVASSIPVGSRALAEADRFAAEHSCAIESANIVDAAALVEQIDQLADLYRGETVAVVASHVTICAALECADPPTQPVTIAVDSDGWSVLPT